MIRNSEGPSVQSVGRAVHILEILADDGAGVGVTEMGKRLGVTKATASRLLSTLADRGLVERDPSTDRYRLGFGLVRLAGAAAAGLDVVRQARPVLEDLAERTGETVNLAVLDGEQVVNIDQIASSRLVVNVNWVGKRTPLHCTSNGKVLLAHLPAARRDVLLARPLEALTPRTVTDRDLLRAQLLEAIARGYATTLEELEVGLNAVAAPVRDGVGDVVAAVSVAGPAYRVTAACIRMLGAQVRDAGEEISRRMGYVERSTLADAER